MLGLSGDDPVTFDPDHVNLKMEKIKRDQRLRLARQHVIPFDAAENIVFRFFESLNFHPNALTFEVFLNNGNMASET